MHMATERRTIRMGEQTWAVLLDYDDADDVEPARLTIEPPAGVRITARSLRSLGVGDVLNRERSRRSAPSKVRGIVKGLSALGAVPRRPHRDAADPEPLHAHRARLTEVYRAAVATGISAAVCAEVVGAYFEASPATVLRWLADARSAGYLHTYAWEAAHLAQRDLRSGRRRNGMTTAELNRRATGERKAP
jgi:hypothetical protein